MATIKTICSTANETVVQKLAGSCKAVQHKFVLKNLELQR